MTHTFEQIVLRIVDDVVHGGYLTAVVVITLAALAVSALSLWSVAVVVKVLAKRRG